MTQIKVAYFNNQQEVPVILTHDELDFVTDRIFQALEYDELTEFSDKLCTGLIEKLVIAHERFE